MLFRSDMDMIRRDMPLQNIDARLPTFFPYNRPHPLCDLTAQDLVTICGDPHDMEVDGKRRMGAMAIVTHAPQSTQNLLKLPPKGGGFDPPNWRHALIGFRGLMLQRGPRIVTHFEDH